MNGNDILKAMNGIDARFIEEADERSAHKPKIRAADAASAPEESFGAVRLHRSKAVLAAGLAAVIAAGGIFAAVKYANRGVPEDIKAAGQTANGFQPITVQNDYVRLTLNNIESDGRIAVLSFDLDKLYDENDKELKDQDFYVNSLYHGMFNASARDGKGDCFMTGTDSKGSNADDVDCFKSFMVFDEPADVREFDLSVYPSAYSSDFDCDALIEDITFSITVTKNKDRCTLKTDSGKTVSVSELGMFADHETTMDTEKADEKDFKKARFPESITDKNGVVYRSPLNSASFFRLGHNYSDLTYVLIGNPAVRADKIAELWINDTVFKAE